MFTELLARFRFFSIIPNKFLCDGTEVPKYKTKSFIQAVLKKNDLDRVSGCLFHLYLQNVQYGVGMLGAWIVCLPVVSFTVVELFAVPVLVLCYVFFAMFMFMS